MFPLCAKLLEDKLDQRWHERTFLGRQGYKSLWSITSPLLSSSEVMYKATFAVMATILKNLR